MKFILVIITTVLFHAGYQSDPLVELYKIEKNGYVELYAKNKSLYPVTVELEIRKKNLIASKRLPLTEVIEGRGEKQLLQLRPSNPNQVWEFDTKYAVYKGDVFARHNDNYRYQLPYRIGASFKVTQGYGGKFSHTGQQNYAIDFDMPEGTPVYAARGGKVIEVKETFDLGGPEEHFKDKANIVTVLHDDGTFADYSHLKKHGASVLTGQQVRRGQLIGYSGSTGYATGPHLHFNVKKAEKGGRFVTIPVKFITGQGKVTLKEGESYKAL